MLVSVNRSASMHRVIEQSGIFCINLLGLQQRAFVRPFSTHAMRDSRFDTGNWAYHAGVPWLPDACASIFCRVSDTKRFGTHELFIAEVEDVRSTSGSADEPLGWMDGEFARFGSLD